MEIEKEERSGEIEREIIRRERLMKAEGGREKNGQRHISFTEKLPQK